MNRHALIWQSAAHGVLDLESDRGRGMITAWGRRGSPDRCNPARKNDSSSTNQLLENILRQSRICKHNRISSRENWRWNPDRRGSRRIGRWKIVQGQPVWSTDRDDDSAIPRQTLGMLLREQRSGANQRKTDQPRNAPPKNSRRKKYEQTPATPGHAFTWETKVCSKESGKPRLS